MFDPRSDYPVGTRRPDLVRTPAGRPLEEVTLDALRRGELPADDLRASAETLRLQAAVADAAGRTPLAENLRRAAELVALSDEAILELYTALRPRRSTASELLAWAERLDREWSATLTAAFVREAAAVYAERGLLAGRERAAV